MPYIAPVEKREFLAPRHFVHYSGPPQCACATLRPLKWPDAFEGLNLVALNRKMEVYMLYIEMGYGMCQRKTV